MRHFVIYLLLLCPAWCGANNVQISQVSLAGGTQLSFEISWENSWDFDFRSAIPNNHDAVWVFVKVRQADLNWYHATVVTDSTQHSAGSPLVVKPTADGLGVFLRRSDSQAGNISSAAVTLQLQNPVPTDAYAIKVFGVEMVWVQEGPFYLGDSASNHRLGRGDDNSPFYVQSEAAVIIGTTAGTLSDTLGDFAPEGNIPATYPKGFTGFYCMKYELGQEQYKDFLNTLTYRQQQERTSASPSAAAGTLAMSIGNANRNGIRIGVPGSAGTPAVYVCNDLVNDPADGPHDGHNRACNFLSWADFAAYLDWAALRPMTEMEFEKTARGFMNPVAREFAWGTPDVVDANTLTNDGGPWETATDALTGSQGLASHGYNGPQGPIRCGFAADSISNRITSGSGFFGCMEMSGNLWEIVVNTTTQGLQYTGATGDGTLDTDGNANTTNWPLNDGTGAGFKGGGWNSGILPGFRDLAVSDRFYIYLEPVNRRNTSGGRGAR